MVPDKLGCSGGKGYSLILQLNPSPTIKHIWSEGSCLQPYSQRVCEHADIAFPSGVTDAGLELQSGNTAAEEIHP